MDRSKSSRKRRYAVVWIRLEGRLQRCSPIEDSEKKTLTWLRYSNRTREGGLLDSVLLPWADSKEVDNLVCTKQRSILDLPDDCLVTLFSNLEHHEICNVAIVCKRFYEISRNPILWKSVELSFTALLKSKNFSLDVDAHSNKERFMTNARRRELFVSFLTSRRATLRDIRACIDINQEADMFLGLINNCNLTQLQSIDLKWSHSWNHCAPVQVRSFQKLLRKLAQKKCKIKFLRCYLDVSCVSAHLLGRLQTIQHLNLKFLCRVKYRSREVESVLQPEVLSIILSSLPNLKHLKIAIAQFIPDYFPGYELKSDSLEELVFGYTKQFLIKTLILPKLRTIKGECLCHDGSTNQTNVCLFDLIERGCPLIQTLNNHTSLTPGLANFNLSEHEKVMLFLCSCPDHVPWRIYY